MPDYRLSLNFVCPYCAKLFTFAITGDKIACVCGATYRVAEINTTGLGLMPDQIAMDNAKFIEDVMVELGVSNLKELNAIKPFAVIAATKRLLDKAKENPK